MFLVKFKLFLLHVFVCAHTHAVQCVKIRGQITTPLSTMWVWVPNSGHWLSLAAWSLPVSNLDDSQADTGLSMIRLLLLVKMKCQWLEQLNNHK